MDNDIPPITQEYLNRHPELEAKGYKVGDPLPDAPQPMIREVIENKEEPAANEPKIKPPVYDSLNSTGAMEDIKKSRDGEFMIYTIRRANQPDEIVKTISGSQEDIDMDLRMNNSLPKPKEEEKSDVETFAVYDEYKRLVRSYNAVDHGEKAEELANQFASKINGYVLKK